MTFLTKCLFQMYIHVTSVKEYWLEAHIITFYLLVPPFDVVLHHLLLAVLAGLHPGRPLLQPWLHHRGSPRRPVHLQGPSCHPGSYRIQ